MEPGARPALHPPLPASLGSSGLRGSEAAGGGEGARRRAEPAPSPRRAHAAPGARSRRQRGPSCRAPTLGAAERGSRPGRAAAPAPPPRCSPRAWTVLPGPRGVRAPPEAAEAAAPAEGRPHAPARRARAAGPPPGARCSDSGCAECFGRSLGGAPGPSGASGHPGDPARGSSRGRSGAPDDRGTRRCPRPPLPQGLASSLRRRRPDGCRLQPPLFAGLGAPRRARGSLCSGPRSP